MKQRAGRARKKNRTVSGSWKVQLGYYLMMCLPVLVLILFNYVPMAGIYMAFVDFKPAKGIFGSDWVGLKWFLQFFRSMDFPRIFRNTILYNLVNILLVKIGCGVFFALLLYEIKSRLANKVFQTAMLLPNFLSWTVISACLYMFLAGGTGFFNQFLEAMGINAPFWYGEAKYWPFIIPVTAAYKGAGMASIYFFAALLSIDTELFDAARMDGASRLQQIRHISLPAVKGVISITLILAMGEVLTSGISPYYELTFDQGALYETTQVIGTYLKNGLMGGRYSYTAAVGLAESLISVVMVVGANGIVNKIDPDNALF